MMYTKALSLAVAAAALAMSSCSEKGGGPKAESKPGAAKKDDHAAHGKGPTGGVVFDLGKYHAEFTVDHGKKECTIITLGNDETTPVAVAAQDLTVTTKATKTKDGKDVPPMTIKLVPQGETDGKASKFVGTDSGLGNVADFEGTVTGLIDGKPSQGQFQEE